MCALIAVAIAWVCWGKISFVEGSGTDASWQAGLAMATNQGLAFGRRAVFTYGPLGFVSDDPFNWVSGLSLTAFVYLALARVGVAAAILLGARQVLGRALLSTLVATGLTWLLVSQISDTTETAILMVLIGWALRIGLEGRRSLGLAVFLGAACAVELMNKVSIGISFTLMSAVLLIVLPQRRWQVLATGVVSGLVSFLVAWLSLGQPLGSIPDYVWGAIQVSGGYAAAMAVPDLPGTKWIYTLFLGMLLAGLWAGWDCTEGAPMRRRFGLMLAWTIFWFFGFKEAIIRGHLFLFAEYLLVGWFAFGSSRGARWRDGAIRMLVGATALTTGLLVLNGGSLTSNLHPAASASALVGNVDTVFSPRLLARGVAQTRRSLRLSENVDARDVALLRGHTVSVFSSEIAAVYALRLRWDPIPVLQSYSAYTPYLDHLDANFVNSSAAPQRILVTTSHTNPAESIDNRVLGFDEPETTRAMLCRYRLLHAGINWAVLGRTVDRCPAGPTRLFSRRVDWGQTVLVPAPLNNHSVTIVKVAGAQVHGLEALKSFLYKPMPRYIDLNGRYFRFVSANGPDGLVMRASPGFDLPPPFNWFLKRP
jgi:hypothetical protein